MLKTELRERIVARHRDGLHRHGHAPQALYWSSAEAQQTRFRILAEAGIRPGDSLLDVGCGFADLKTWLEQHDCPVAYSGIDLSPDLLRVARRCHADAAFYCGELDEFGFNDAAFDWVVLSGALNEPFEGSGDYVRQTIAAMYRICRRGIAFNLLDATRGFTLKSFGLQHFDPADIERYCRSLDPYVRLVRGYLIGDFTVYLWKETAAMPPEV